MEIFPAVDLYEGKVVRLEQGDYQKCKVYSVDPAEIARQWAKAGARWLHVVDLEGAKGGEIKNWHALRQILSSVKISIEFGGGVRRREDVEQLLKMGVKRVILGTKGLDPSFLSEITQAHGSQIALSLDLRGEEIQVEGWLKGSGKSVFDLLADLPRYSLDCIIVTDVERDGMLAGINFEKIKHILEKSTLPIILSGGITSLDDIRSLNSIRSNRLRGVVIGKALYEGRVDLAQALQLTQQRGEG